VGLAALALVAGLIWPGPYATEQTADRSFVIDLDFTQVRKILVRTDAVKQIVTMGGSGRFVDQKWTAVGGELDVERLLDPNWKLELHGTLQVRTGDPYIGAQLVTLRQDVTINPDELDSRVDLLKASERLLDYEMQTRFVRDGDRTRVEQRLSQEILTTAPWFAHAIARRRVRASAEQALVNQEAAIRKVIDANRGRQWLFPLR
jgi:hypothetical protein